MGGPQGPAGPQAKGHPTAEVQLCDPPNAHTSLAQSVATKAMRTVQTSTRSSCSSRAYFLAQVTHMRPN